MKQKDPAFLFYSKDYYEGTRTMLPQERACYVDLMIYQHQNGGFIPFDLKRILLYCSGVDEATLTATLEAKFVKKENGWVNEKLQKVIEQRVDFSAKQSVNGAVGQFFKKAKSILSDAEFLSLKAKIQGKSNDELYLIIKDLEINKATLKAMLKHRAVANAIGNASAIGNKEIKDAGYFIAARTLWFKFYTDTHPANGHNPTFDGMAGKKIKSILSKLKKKADEKEIEWNEQSALDSFEMLLIQASKTNWIKDNFALQNIDSKFDQIIQQALTKNVTGTKAIHEQLKREFNKVG